MNPSVGSHIVSGDSRNKIRQIVFKQSLLNDSSASSPCEIGNPV